jgi:hypothetical protein
MGEIQQPAVTAEGVVVHLEGLKKRTDLKTHEKRTFPANNF